MKVILNKDIKNLGKVGEAVQVKDGFARNYLFPRKLAVKATEKNVKQMEHLRHVAEQKKKKIKEERKRLVEEINGITLKFTRAAGETDKLFGSVTAHDISEALEKEGYLVDKRDIHLEETIKTLGQHKAMVKLGEGLEAEIVIAIDREEIKA
ncbi:MAG: 50S ribosomal protein L9 [Planctomycetota bacterium]|nr:MAG: 50S ribosomal protein L9 [Planctomycetota bacterium]